MIYNKFGKTGIEISALGFGSMRLPMVQDSDNNNHVDMDKAVAMMRHGFDLGINYVDSAYGYCASESEIAVGKALKGYRDKVYLSTKLPLGNIKATGDFDRHLTEQLTKLDVDYIDFYHFHGVSNERLENVILKYKLIDEALKAKSAGLIRHLSFSFHDKPEIMNKIIDLGVFSSVLCQYNLLDRTNEPAIAYAVEQGLGVVGMGPVGGGRLSYPSEFMQYLVEQNVSTPELALRFVISNPNIHCALSGMGNLQMVDENVKTASISEPLSSDELQGIDATLKQCQSLADIYCTGCGYCMPCPHEVNIPACFAALILKKVYKLDVAAVERYNTIKPVNQAAACVKCGACEKKCPQNIPITKRLKETTEIITRADRAV